MDPTSGQLDDLIDSVADFIDRHRLLAEGDSAILGISGGADSVVLLEVMGVLAARAGRSWRLTVAHLNHLLRPDADADADFVAGLAQLKGLPCVVERQDVGELARRLGLGIEEAARKARYEFLARLAAQSGAQAVAVGHQADDNVETILYRIVRGTHIRGLSGIPVQRRLAGCPARLVRPLLGVRRAQIEAFCRRRGLTWRTDITNSQTGYRRNFIRHELLPLLRRRLNSRADEALLRLGRAAAEVEAHLARQAGELLQRAAVTDLAEGPGPDGPPPQPDFPRPPQTLLNAAILAAEPAVVRRCALRLALERMGVPGRGLTADVLEALAGMAEADSTVAMSLPGGGLASRRRGVLALTSGASRGQTEPPPEGAGESAARAHRLRSPRHRPAGPSWESVLDSPGQVRLPDGRLVVCRLEAHDQAAFDAHCRGHPAGVEVVDAGEVRFPLRCRPWRSGDSFVPLGGSGRQTVSNFLTNLKLRPSARREVLCLMDDRGLIYLAPLRIADRVKVTRQTRAVLRIELRQGRPQGG